MPENQQKIKAEVALISFCGLTFEGLMSENGEFGIGVPQICTTFNIDQNQATRYIKSLLGKECNIDKWHTQFRRNYVNVLLITEFEKLLAKLDRAGNKVSQNFRDDLAGLSLVQIFSDAFHVKFEVEERQAWRFNRDRSKTTFKKYLTDSLKAYGYTENWQYGKFIHEMQAGLGIEDGTRDDLDNETLVKLTTTQESIGLAIEIGLEPYEAMRRCINRMN
jgi:hypothetical protein